MQTHALSSLGVFRLRPDLRPSDATFPLGLGESGVHEVCEAAYGDMPALTGFVLAASKIRSGALFWITQSGLGLDHGGIFQNGIRHIRRGSLPILSASPRKLSDALWMIEEAIRSNAVGLVIAEIEDADFTASRRLALASSHHGVPVILLMPYTRQGATAATARWRVSPRASAPNHFDSRAPGCVRWHAVLERSRQVPHMAGRNFNLELNYETLSLLVVSGLAAHAVAPSETGCEDHSIASTIRSLG